MSVARVGKSLPSNQVNVISNPGQGDNKFIVVYTLVKMMPWRAVLSCIFTVQYCRLEKKDMHCVLTGMHCVFLFLPTVKIQRLTLLAWASS